MADEYQLADGQIDERIGDYDHKESQRQKGKSQGGMTEINFEISQVNPADVYRNLEAFKAVLGDMIGIEKGADVGFDELIGEIFSKLHDYTSEELIGLALYLVNMILIHKSALSEESMSNLFESLILLIEQSIESKNPACLFITIEALGRKGLSRAVGSKPSSC